MKARAALLLLVAVLAFAESQSIGLHPKPIPEKVDLPSSELPDKIEAHVHEIKTTESSHVETTTLPTKPILKESLLRESDYRLPLTNPKEILLEEIRSLDENVPASKIQEELSRALKAEAEKSRVKPRGSTLKPRTKIISPTPNAISSDNKVSAELDKVENAELKALKRDEATFDEDFTEDDEDDDEDDDDDADDEYDDDDDDDDDEDDDDIADEEEVMTECPDYCRCSGQYAGGLTARCSKLIDKQNFGPQIAHLRIENAGEINLGPQGLRVRNLQQLESLTIVDTRIAALEKSAFNGSDYLFAMNLTRNALINIEPDMFENNTQLSLLTISGQPLGRTWGSSKDYLLNASSVTEFDFSSNGITRLPRAAFSKMANLGFINLKNNRLRNIESSILEAVSGLVEIDLSGNLLVEIPAIAVTGKELQTLRISSNNLTKLNLQQPSKLVNLDASNNRIKVITKDDLEGVPSLDKLVLSSNGIKRIHQHSFSLLESLSYLDISDNKITNLSEHHLRSNPRLQIVLMNDNPGLGSLPIFKAIGYEYETFSIYRFECANCGLESLLEGTFDSMPALTRINLARNRLTGLPSGLLQGMSSLRDLDLSDNLISTLQPKMFSGARSLSKLSLAGNPLVSLQVTPFLQTPGLIRLDVSRCQLQRVWSEARQSMRSLRFLSVRSNELQRITLEELKAMPRLSGLDASSNPFSCDQDFNQAIQWLVDHGVTPTEELKLISNYGNAEDYNEAEGVTQWTDLAKLVCDNGDDGPPPRTIQHKLIDDLPIFALPKDTMLGNKDNHLDEPELNHGQRFDGKFEDIFKDEYNEYDGLNDLKEQVEADYESDSRTWYSSSGIIGWRVMTIVIAVLTLVVAICQIARIVASRRGRGPVIRPPMILRQGLVDNKNCGLVYKPLQEEIATPHMPKRGSFYSSSTFHYDKIVPESV